MISMEAAIDPSGDIDVMLYVVLSLIGLCLEMAAYTKCYQTMIDRLKKRYDGTKGTASCLPDRMQQIVGMIWDGIFILVGLCAIRPFFGLFGSLWALVAGAFILLHAWSMYSTRHIRKKRRTEHSGRQLEQLDTLRSAGLLSDQEYRQKRDEILRGL